MLPLHVSRRRVRLQALKAERSWDDWAWPQRTDAFCVGLDGSCRQQGPVWAGGHVAASRAYGSTAGPQYQPMSRIGFQEGAEQLWLGWLNHMITRRLLAWAASRAAYTARHDAGVMPLDSAVTLHKSCHAIPPLPKLKLALTSPFGGIETESIVPVHEYACATAVL
jgi:hypothetical protein